MGRLRKGGRMSKAGASLGGLPRWGLVLVLALGLCGPLSSASARAAAETIRVAVLKFGTVNWELDVIRRHGLDEAEGIELSVLGLASKNATSVALQAGEADMIVTDWIWVSRQRAEGALYTFVPFSTALGALMVTDDSPIETLADLAGRRLGIAGGPLDKSWLLLQALTDRQLGMKAQESVDAVFAAPPLLNQQILSGRLDAVLNFWHFAARLEAAGLKRMLGVDQMLSKFGIGSKVPLIGYVFDEQWGNSKRDGVAAFFRATRNARKILAESDEEWEHLRPLMKVSDEKTFVALREGYRAGIPKRWGEAERADAALLFSVLAEQGGTKLVGRSKSLQEGTFWPHEAY